MYIHIYRYGYIDVSMYRYREREKCLSLPICIHTPAPRPQILASTLITELAQIIELDLSPLLGAIASSIAALEAARPLPLPEDSPLPEDLPLSEDLPLPEDPPLPEDLPLSEDVAAAIAAAIATPTISSTLTAASSSATTLDAAALATPALFTPAFATPALSSSLAAAAGSRAATPAVPVPAPAVVLAAAPNAAAIAKPRRRHFSWLAATPELADTLPYSALRWANRTLSNGRVNAAVVAKMARAVAFLREGTGGDSGQVYIYIDIRTYIHIHTYKIYTYTYIHIHTHTHTLIYIIIFIYIHIYLIQKYTAVEAAFVLTLRPVRACTNGRHLQIDRKRAGFECSAATNESIITSSFVSRPALPQGRGPTRRIGIHVFLWRKPEEYESRLPCI